LKEKKKETSFQGRKKEKKKRKGSGNSNPSKSPSANQIRNWISFLLDRRWVTKFKYHLHLCKQTEQT
jgi:hypothetical protein